MGERHTTIRVSTETKNRLKSYGEMGMSYDDVVMELLDRIEEVDAESGER